jgi:thiol-disulfide isomerase/thioredoxin
MKTRTVAAIAALLALHPAAGSNTLSGLSAADRIVHVSLAYRAPGDGPKPNFSPKGAQVPLEPLPPNAPLPPGAARPAKTGLINIGTGAQPGIPVLVTADADHPNDLCRLFVDRNRNGNFADDGPARDAVPKQNEKTKAWWSSFDRIELSVLYGQANDAEPYMVNAWIVRDGDAPPDVLRYSAASWREGTVTIDGVNALVAAMDGNNDAVFVNGDYWSVLPASAPGAAQAVLSHTEARPTNRLMFLPTAARELALEFRSFSPDGRSIDFAIVDRPTSKSVDRAADDVLASERSRPRAATPFQWDHDFTTALAHAASDRRRLIVDFEATWCGPCKTMDEWIWTDAEVASKLQAGYAGVKLDGDVEKALVKRFHIVGYPTMIVLDSGGKEAHRVVGYQSSSEMIALLNREP